MHVLNNNILIRQGQPANSIPDDRARAGTRSEIVSKCPEQFAGPANNFDETCCRPTYNTLEANYLQALTQNVQTPVETEHVKTAFLTLNVMGEDQAKRLLRSIAENFEEFTQRELEIAKITKQGTGGSTIDNKVSKSTLNKINNNLRLLKYAIKVADAFLDSPDEIKNKLFSAVRGKQFHSANQQLIRIRNVASANFEKAKEIRHSSSSAKTKNHENAGTSYTNNNAKRIFETEIAKLQTLCPSYSFTVIGNYKLNPPSPAFNNVKEVNLSR